jgi:UDP-N-acetylmuramoyl-L-alanyl-D-glutamate--2,6-diaminopimelate ligase
MLRDLLDGIDVLSSTGSLDVEVTGIAHDSRRVRAGDAFYALAGARHDGSRFARDAVAAGARAVVGGAGPAPEGATHVTVAEPRLALARAACRLHGDPSRAMTVVAVTGTNGKTTTTWMLESILGAAGKCTGLIGTTGVRIAGVLRPSVFTTPEAPELQALLAGMRDGGVQAVAMEVSSHALVQRRAWGLAADVCVFTNLTQDHLDFHRTMESYLDAKLMLFDGRNGGAGKRAVAVVNADDAAAPGVEAAARRGGMSVHRFGAGAATTPGVRVERVVAEPGGLALTLVPVPAGAGQADRPLAFTLPMLGRYNAWNAAGAAAAALALGLDPATVVAGLAAPIAVPGRLERVETGQPFAVVVDYAHTPDALERALAAVREHFRGRVIVVFGCGGDRDAGKRPLMGRVAAERADRVWITNDNPRGEDPAAIAAAIRAGAGAAARPTPIATVLDRRAAIDAALGDASSGDVVLIAGKGHETTQTIGGIVHPFDDRVVARERLAARGWRGGSP